MPFMPDQGLLFNSFFKFMTVHPLKKSYPWNVINFPGINHEEKSIQ